MKVYVSKRNENVTAKIIKEDEKFKTVVIEYLTGDKAGQNNSITTSTLKRWWKETEIEEVEEKIPFPAEPVNHEDVGMKMEEAGLVQDTESELTDEQYAQIESEIAEQDKQKSKEHKDSPELESVVDKLHEEGFTVNIVKGLPKTISIKNVGQLALSKNCYRLKANLKFEFKTETSYELKKTYKKVVFDNLEDVIKVIK